MRLAPASHKRELLAVLVIAVAGLAAAFVAAGGADARPARPTSVVPNGTYGALGPRGEYVVFTVRNRKVRDLNFNMQITCQASDEPSSEQRYFGAGAQAPQGRRIPANGKLVLNWYERAEGRYGQVSVEIKFGVRDVFNASVIVPEESFAAGPEDTLESCDGVSSLRFHRGFESPVP
ncbi:MAG TPA: hypothetical protein VNR67_04230 [Solirubrobacterales bacterium]|nr:hypothetical protein [Solirubrobacterales bacterium]